MNIPENIYATTKNIISWGYDVNIIGDSTPKDQLCKGMQEFGELSDAVCKDNREEIILEAGDLYVTLVLMLEMYDLSIYECAEAAYKKISTRKGIMFDGVFVKETDKEYLDILKKLGRE